MESSSEKKFDLNWLGVLSALDKNFFFRSVDKSGNYVSYRLAPNGNSLGVRRSGDKIIVDTPFKDVNLKEISSDSLSGLHSYFINSFIQLDGFIQKFKIFIESGPVNNKYSQSGKNNIEDGKGNSMPQATNTILYGPPGTGKTYATAAKAVQLCDGVVPTTREELMQRYRQLSEEHRISFVTFHQSFGYEEFVEGLRPQIDQSDQISYAVLPGIFKKACEAARMHQFVDPRLNDAPLSDRNFWKMSLGFSGNEEGKRVFQYCLKHQCVLLGYGGLVDFSECETKEDIQNVLEDQAPNLSSPRTTVAMVNDFKNEIKIGDIIIVSNGNSMFRGVAEVVDNYEFVDEAPFHQMRKVKWLAVFEVPRPSIEILQKKFTMRTLYKISHENINIESLYNIVSDDSGSAVSKPYVLIIDEINRANISKVFGELITLLEPDKREGELNQISVKLPYSGEDFSIPPNLHVIGTMNTADRSIALLDSALRRRFDFIELDPDYSVLNDKYVNGINLAKLLYSLNKRIEAIFDKNHCIGHAFFIDVIDLNHLIHVFRRKVIPLLQEYFYENLSNVRRVLNDCGTPGDFILCENASRLPSDGEDIYSDESRVIYSVNPQPFPIEAFKRIYADCA